MNDFLLVILIAGIAAFLTYLGAPAAERFEVSDRVVSSALQFAAGIITALVAFSLMPPAIQNASLPLVVLGFFVGGVLFVVFEVETARRQKESNATNLQPHGSLGFYFGVLVDLFVDGVVIGVGSTLTLKTGLLLALGMAISTVPLAFVTIATARRQGMSPERRRQLARLFFIFIILGAILGFGLIRHQPDPVKMILIATAAGFLITMVTQSIIPEANREGEPSFAGVLYIGGISLYALLALTLR